ncbi:HEPN domain-containing protein [Okeania sp. SIO2C9]|uniref:HEPN domain-containing protein n=1 Tax=Okeania sp. SIO2C9 TaxID=2607791 RepID=UPI0025E49816|nr:HEPN domain-containing protein [Okeania sp. SIO2C9]
MWQEVGNIMGRTDKDIKQELKIIIDRRNKIAHEADIDPTLSLGNRWGIDEIMVGDAVDFIEEVVDSIHSII